MARRDTARPQTVSAPVRLTRRGRIVVGALVTMIVAAVAALIWLAIAGQAQAASHVGPAGPAGHSMLRVVVLPGQTLWSIAVKADPAADPRAVIQQIVDDNALAGTAITAGQVLWVPR
jgi:predicted metal-binding membrane protein